jgi:hypothetical protein
MKIQDGSWWPPKLPYKWVRLANCLELIWNIKGACQTKKSREPIQKYFGGCVHQTQLRCFLGVRCGKPESSLITTLYSMVNVFTCMIVLSWSGAVNKAADKGVAMSAGGYGLQLASKDRGCRLPDTVGKWQALFGSVVKCSAFPPLLAGY